MNANHLTKQVPTEYRIGWALVAVNRIEGSFYNVMGFPSHLVHKELEKIAATLNPKQQFYEV